MQENNKYYAIMSGYWFTPLTVDYTPFVTDDIAKINITKPFVAPIKVDKESLIELGINLEKKYKKIVNGWEPTLTRKHAEEQAQSKAIWKGIFEELKKPCVKTDGTKFPKGGVVNDIEEKFPETGKKENNGKTDYSELNWDFVDGVCNRFAANKNKYPKDNMKKPIDKKELIQAAMRHLRKMLQPIETDSESFEEHLYAVGCNMSMAQDQINIEKKDKLLAQLKK